MPMKNKTFKVDPEAEKAINFLRNEGFCISILLRDFLKKKMAEVLKQNQLYFNKKKLEALELGS